MSNQTPLRALSARVKFKIDRRIADKLAELDRAHQLGMQRLGDLASTDLRGVWENLQRRATDALRKAENVDQVAEIAEPTRQTIERTAADQRASLKNSLRVISKEAHEIAGPEIRRFVLAARQHLTDLEDAQIELARSYSIEAQANPVIMTLKAEIDRLAGSADRAWTGSIVRPASLTENFCPISE